ncbi:hypothetical protein ACF0H5_009624 [Mactra antiquata]
MKVPSSAYLCLYFTILLQCVNCDICTVCQCNNTTHSIDCSYRNLTFVPNNSLHNTILLNLTNNNFGRLDVSSFTTYPNLRILDLSNAGLTNITKDVFQGLSSLLKLNLSMNELLPFTDSTVPTDLFGGLTTLIELKIYGTTIAFQNEENGYPNTALAKLSNLRELWIDGLNNKSFGIMFRNMKSLKSIYLRGDLTIFWRFCYQPKVSRTVLEHLINVEQFTMRRCAIKVIEKDSFSDMIQLREVDLSNNMLLSLDGVLDACVGLSNSRLEILHLNNIDDIRGSCGVWVNETMTMKLANLTNLKTVYLAQNKLNGFIKGAIRHLPKSIEKIDVSMNFFDFSYYILELSELSSLKWFDISYNHFPDPTAIWHGLDIGQSYAYEEQSEMNFTLSRESCQDNLTLKKQQWNSCSKDSEFHHSGFMDEYVSRLFSPYYRNGLNDKENNFEETSEKKYICPRQITFPPEIVTAFLPKNLQHVDISNSKLAHPIPECYFDDDNNVVSINASKSLLYCWDGPIHGLKRLEYLDLSSNMCRKVKKSFFDTCSSLKYLSISNNLLTDYLHKDVGGRLLKYLTALETFDMSMNRLEKIPPMFFIHQGNLTTLNASYNALRYFEIKIDHFVHLRQVDLSHNYITTLSKEMRQQIVNISDNQHHATVRPLELNLAHNYIHCFCYNLDFLKWVYDHMSTCRFLDVKITSCMLDNSTITSIRNRNELGNIINDLNEQCRSYTGIIIASCFACVIFAVIFASVIGYRLRWKMTYWYYVKSRDYPKLRSGYYDIDDRRSSTYKFDVYISSLENIRSLALDDMKRAFEDNDFKVFIQSEDIVPGQNMYCMIANAIHVSRVIVFIVSDFCDEDREWRIAMRMAHEESLSRGYPIYFGVFIGNSPRVNDSEDIREIRNRKHLTYSVSMQQVNNDTFLEDLVQYVSDIAVNEIISMSG